MQRSMKTYCFLFLIWSNGIKCSDEVNSSSQPITSGSNDVNSTSTILKPTTIKPTRTAQLLSSTVTRSTQEPVKDMVIDWLFSLEKGTLLLINAILFITCIFLLITSLTVSCKLLHLKFSRHYQVQSKMDLAPNEVTSSGREMSTLGDGEPSELYPMINETSKAEEENKNKSSEEEMGAVTDEVTEEEMPGTETAPNHENMSTTITFEHCD